MAMVRVLRVALVLVVVWVVVGWFYSGTGPQGVCLKTRQRIAPLAKIPAPAQALCAARKITPSV
jgi:hypothetical protein